MDMELIKKAIIISSTAHKDQCRKGTQIPYIVHPYEVGFILRDNGFSQNLIIAGLLHDTLEDTNLSKEYIKNEFGQDVLDIIIQVTETKEEKRNLTWKERKEIAINRLKNASKDAKIVACADKLSNIKSMLEGYQIEGKDFFKIFNTDDYEEHKWHYRSSLDALIELEGMSLYEELKEYINILFNE